MCRQKLRGAKSLTLYLPMSQTLVSLITNTVLAYVTDIGVSNYLPWLFFFFLPVYYLYIPLLECKLSMGGGSIPSSQYPSS